MPLAKKKIHNSEVEYFCFCEDAAAAAAVIITFLSHLRNSASLQVSGCVVVFADSDFESEDAAGNIS